MSPENMTLWKAVFSDDGRWWDNPLTEDEVNRLLNAVRAEERARAVEVVRPFARACELLDEGLSVAIALDDGTVLVPDEAFRHAAAYISDSDGGA